MVKGVNKQIIEINDTGNKYFEKVLLFITPGKKDLPADFLQSKAREQVLDFSKNLLEAQPLREKIRRNRAKQRALFVAGIAVAVALCSAVIIKFL